MNEFLGFAPEIGAVVGYAGTRVLGAHAQKKSEQQELAVINEYGPIAGMLAPDAIPLSPKQRLAKWMSPIALTGMVAGGLFAPAFFSDQAPQHTTNAVLELVDDAGGQELGDGSAERVRTILEAFVGDQKLQVDVVVARGGAVVDEGDKLSAAQVLTNSNYSPVGTLSLDLATSAAMADAAHVNVAAASNVIGGASEATSAVLVISDNDPVGDASEVITQAKSSGERVYIANVGSGGGQTSTDLRSIATQTGGQYWPAYSNPKLYAHEIEKAIDPIGLPAPKPSKNEWQDFLKFLDITALVTVGITAGQMAEFRFKRKKD